MKNYLFMDNFLFWFRFFIPFEENVSGENRIHWKRFNNLCIFCKENSSEQFKTLLPLGMLHWSWREHFLTTRKCSESKAFSCLNVPLWRLLISMLRWNVFNQFGRGCCSVHTETIYRLTQLKDEVVFINTNSIWRLLHFESLITNTFDLWYDPI